ncbi:chorismate mutase [Oxyplasma meridianum]|uniref:Chorismate mutase n=1 Tax=Oxyplasma meridianum TaxID=3073602 RepID=A0AAX4NEI1_9ARCH
MIYFIRDATSGLLEKVRKDILQNTMELVRLFKEREELSRIIASVKEKENFEIRDRRREEIVLNKLGNLSPRQRSILNMIFEFSISCQDKVDETLEVYLSERCLQLSGENSILEYVAGLLSSRPGSEIYSSRELDSAFVLGAVRNGAHIINDSCDSPDLRIGHSRDKEIYHISLDDSGTMSLNPVILQVNFSFTRVQVD